MKRRMFILAAILLIIIGAIVGASIKKKMDEAYEAEILGFGDKIVEAMNRVDQTYSWSDTFNSLKKDYENAKQEYSKATSVSQKNSWKKEMALIEERIDALADEMDYEFPDTL